jgi:putative spermidine/putrescine transport system permease protein
MKRMPLLLLLPMLLLGALFLLGIGNALVQSFGYIPALHLRNFTFRYYEEIFARPALMDSVRVSLEISILSSVLATVLGVALCASLVRTGHVRGTTLQIVKLPILIPHTVAALFVIMILSEGGLLARTLHALGLLDSQKDFPAFLYGPGSLGIVIAYIWKETPFIAYYALAAISSIDSTLGEAAENLGASRLRSFFRITLPLSMPAIANAFLIVFAYSFGAYELPFLLGATLPKALPVQAYVEYIHPDLLHRPYAMAMNGLMLAVTLLMYGLLYGLVRRGAKAIGEAGHGT